jgi:hypothetical protein
MSTEITTPAPQPMLSPETLQDGPWFESVRRAYEVRTKPAHPPAWLVPLVGFSIAGLIWLLGYPKTAIAGAVIVAVMTILELALTAVARKVQKGLAVFGAWAGQGIGWVLLCPLFLIIGPVSRVFSRVMGEDPLGRRRAGDPSYWQFAAPEPARTRKSASMFCVERRTAGGRNWLGALVLLGLAGLAVSELVFRFYFHFHNPLLYMHDSACGYRLRPNQDIQSARGRVQTNNYSMRYARDVTPEKPAGVFRILVLSDSTGFGGEYHTNEQTYAGVMEARLNERYGTAGKKFEVLPVCVNGWSPHHALGYVKRFGNFNADLALITIPAGDIDRPFSIMSSTRYMSSKPRFALSTVMVMAVQNVKDRLVYHKDYCDNDEEFEKQLDAGVAAFRDLGLLLKQLGSRDVIYESFPQMTYNQNAIAGTIEKDGFFYRYYERLRPALESAGFMMEYPQTIFKGMVQDEVLRDTGHLAEKGHSLFADYLIGQLAARSAGFRQYAGLPEPVVPHQPNLPKP